MPTPYPVLPWFVNGRKKNPDKKIIYCYLVKLRGLFRTQYNIYDGAFFAKIANG